MLFTAKKYMIKIFIFIISYCCTTFFFCGYFSNICSNSFLDFEIISNSIFCIFLYYLVQLFKNLCEYIFCNIYMKINFDIYIFSFSIM